jgi:hypothetical protein
VELRTEIEIAASPDRVWDVLTDFPAYHEWNPFMTQVEGTLAVGSKLRVTLSPPESDEVRLTPVLVVCDAPHELRWLAKRWVPGLLDGEHFFRCVEAGAGRTRFIHGENLRGLWLKFSGEHVKQLARGFVYMNEALERRVARVERRAAASS